MSKFRCLARPYIIPAADNKGGGLRQVFDVEADNLLDKATTTHCIVITDLDRDQVNAYGPTQIGAALEHLARADYLVGHNIVGYDLPLLQRLYNWTPAPGCAVLDTLIASRLILPHIADLDDQAAAMGGPKLARLRGRYSLEAWGVRLGIPKIGTDITDWSRWTPEMQERCIGDVAICKLLYHFLQPDGYSSEAVVLEHRVAAICDRISSDGVPFNIDAAVRLCQQWTVRRAELAAQLAAQFPDTNFNSRKQIGALLEARGWTPEKRTEKTGQPQISDEVLETIPPLYPEFAGLTEFMILGRRIAQLAEGTQAWCKHVGGDGHIHGRLVHIGTPHSRAKHLTPNLAQVPNPKKGKPFASECRALFRPSNSWVFVTADQSGLQDRGFAHYIAEFDAGAYAATFSEEVDTHWRTTITLGLVPENTARDKQNKVHEALREGGGKRFRYAFLYGVGTETAGRIINDAARAAVHIDATNDLQQRFFSSAARPNKAALTQVGKLALDRFMAGTPGLRRLRESLQAHARQHGWLLGLDGRRVPVRALYTALNFIVTASEAIICKRWLVRVYDELCARFRYGWDGDVVIALWVHDEIACCCRPEIAEQVGEILVRHAKEPGAFYHFKVPLEADYKVGRSWAGEPLEAGDGGGDYHDDGGDNHDDAGLERDDIGITPPERTTGGDKPVVEIGIAGAQLAPEPEAPPILTWEAVMAAFNKPRPAVANGPAKSNGPDLTAWPPLASVIGQPLQDGNKISCPFHADPTPSCHVYPNHFHCYGCGAHGSALDWLMRVEGMTQDMALQTLQTWSGPRTQPVDDNAAAERARRMLALAAEIWNAAGPIAGTLAERYLIETRKLELAGLPDISAVLRFHPQCPFNGGDRHPCLVALFRDVETDAPAGIHRIALTGDAQKIDRRMLGSWPAPRAIKLWPAGRILVAGEGIETVLAAASRCSFQGAPLHPAWAMASKDNLERLPPVASVERLIVLADNDVNAQGQAAARACALTWHQTGRDVVVLMPRQPDSDFNDLVMPGVRP